MVSFLAMLGSIIHSGHSGAAFAADSKESKTWTATLAPSELATERSPWLQFDQESFEVQEGYVEGVSTAYVELMGSFDSKGGGLFYRKKWLVSPSSQVRNFKIKVPVGSEISVLTFGAKGVDKKIRVIRTQLFFPEWKAYRSEKLLGIGGKRSFLSVSLGPTVVQYKEKGIKDYNSTVITAKIFYRYALMPPRWDVALSTYFTVIPISASRTDATARFIGLNARVGYSLPFIKEPWGISLLAGWYYLTMVVTDNRFGFRNLSGPQIYPNIRRSLGNKGDSIYFYGKFSPIAGLTLNNREIAGGGGWNKMLQNGHPLIFSIDIANAQFTILRIPINSTSYSLGVGYGL